MCYVYIFKRLHKGIAHNNGEESVVSVEDASAL